MHHPGRGSRLGETPPLLYICVIKSAEKAQGCAMWIIKYKSSNSKLAQRTINGDLLATFISLCFYRRMTSRAEC